YPKCAIAISDVQRTGSYPLCASMADTTSWTEPLDSERERWYLGIECRRGSGEVHGERFMIDAR
ncbi:MAG: hypothetical protein ACRD3R_00065, partial [Terriglobales bacterium]